MGRYRATVTDPAQTQWLGPVEVEAESAAHVPDIVARMESQTLDWFASVGLTVWDVQEVTD